MREKLVCYLWNITVSHHDVIIAVSLGIRRRTARRKKNPRAKQHGVWLRKYKVKIRDVDTPSDSSADADDFNVQEESVQNPTVNVQNDKAEMNDSDEGVHEVHTVDEEDNHVKHDRYSGALRENSSRKTGIGMSRTVGSRL